MIGVFQLSIFLKDEPRLLTTDSIQSLGLTIVATNELHDFNHVLGCNYEKYDRVHLIGVN